MYTMVKIHYDPAAQTVIYKTKMVDGPNRNFELFDPLDFLAAVTSDVANRGEHLVRYVLLQRSAGQATEPGRREVAAGNGPALR